MRIIITEEQKKKLFIPRKLDGEGSRWSDWNKEQPIKDGKPINQYDSEGRKTGYWEHYYDNGSVYMRGSFENRRRDGVWEWYDSEGKLLYKELYKNGDFIDELPITESKKLFIPRKLSDNDSRYYEWNNEQPIKDGVRINQYDPEGNKTGYWELYWDNGKLHSKGNYINGIEDGPWKTYHENGQLQRNGSYINGKRDGPWKTYHENGNLEFKGTYLDGMLNGDCEFYWYEGNLAGKGSYKDDKKDGIWEEYFHDGEFWYKGEYKNGKYIKDIDV